MAQLLHAAVRKLAPARSNPSSPQPHSPPALRYLEEHGLAPPRGGPSCIDALELFGHHVRSWLTNSQEGLCAAARSLEATTELSAVTGLGATQPAAPAGGSEEGGVAPIVHEMLRAVVNEMHRWGAGACGGAGQQGKGAGRGVAPGEQGRRSVGIVPGR